VSTRRNISSGAKWEDVVGYSRAVRVGPHVWVAGTTAISGAGEVVGEGDAFAQAAFIFRKIATALEQAGASINDVVRTRMYITRLEDEAGVGKAHAEALGAVRPAATMIQITALVDPRLLVEIEVEAFVQAP
jgi:enamine deaminase RidA (YjgF/YER057c/UK114 family)